jgi:hypothetical protein
MIKRPRPELVRSVETVGWRVARCDVVHRRGHQACRAGWHRRWLLTRETDQGTVVIETGLLSGGMVSFATVTVADVDTGHPVCVTAHSAGELHAVANDPPCTRAEAGPWQNEAARFAQDGLDGLHTRRAAGQDGATAAAASLAAARRQRREAHVSAARGEVNR